MVTRLALTSHPDSGLPFGEYAGRSFSATGIGLRPVEAKQDAKGIILKCRKIAPGFRVPARRDFSSIVVAM
jgi:hypothetical protein